jgi:hypothetical protein
MRIEWRQGIPLDLDGLDQTDRARARQVVRELRAI